MRTQARGSGLSPFRNYIESMKYVLIIDDPLLKQVVKLKMPFNVFRDFTRLEAAYQNSSEAKIYHALDQFNSLSKYVAHRTNPAGGCI